MGDLATIVPAAGGFGVLAIVIGYLLAAINRLLNEGRVERKAHLEDVEAAEKRADRAESRLEASASALDRALARARAAEDVAAETARVQAETVRILEIVRQELARANTRIAELTAKVDLLMTEKEERRGGI